MELVQDGPRDRRTRFDAVGPQPFLRRRSCWPAGFESTRRCGRYLGPGWDMVRLRGVPFNTGDGLRMAMHIGAMPHGSWAPATSPQDINLPPSRSVNTRPPAPTRAPLSYRSWSTCTAALRGRTADLRGRTYAAMGRAILASRAASRSDPRRQGTQARHLSTNYDKPRPRRPPRWKSLRRP
jgi:hypothetical protein